MLFFCACRLRLIARRGFHQFYSNPDALQVAAHTNIKCISQPECGRGIYRFPIVKELQLFCSREYFNDCH